MDTDISCLIKPISKAANIYEVLAIKDSTLNRVICDFISDYTDKIIRLDAYPIKCMSTYAYKSNNKTYPYLINIQFLDETISIILCDNINTLMIAMLSITICTEKTKMKLMNRSS